MPPVDLNLMALALLAIITVFVAFRKKGLPVPPGPSPLPILGNMFDLPQKESWKVYLDWGRQFNSEIISLKVPGTRLHILNSARAVQDLLVKRANIYSDRPNSTMLNDLIGTAWLIPFMNNTDQWREHRRLFRQEFDTPAASIVNKGHEIQATRRLLRRLLTTQDYEGDVRLAAVDTILSITYGITPKNFDHPFIRTPEGLNAIFADVAKGGYLVDMFPLLKHLPTWFPGTKFHKVGAKGRDLALALLMAPYEEVKSQVQNGTAVPSVASKFLYEVQDGSVTSPGEIEIMRNVLGNAYLGGADTSVCALYNFVLAMALHPEVQKKAHKALDDLLGGHRLPEFSDVPHLPYISAITNEILRWHPVTPFAIYHLCTEDNTYDGYHIAKGSMMIPNMWGIMQDESLFGANTDKFDPERFLKPDQSLNPDMSAIDLAFGFGRRTCPGKLLARDTLWILAAHILTAYEIIDPVDMTGKKLTSESSLEYANAMVSFPPRCKMTFRLRIPESIITESLAT
ncbi:hypothetical protein GALMADRAFT_241660 [Galerina marginata CBS 339.88]|uniref:Cytochrome P450 n=1 Tax=Galerina marginata (strain CBS 339.88) TaxID=685588 RepID=A0A067TPZ7_GALM3|nr:hypothetical protein GALMADRAFT_241660 [Galerina marginata CBS 339.88]